jgi:hypothetical protein
MAKDYAAKDLCPADDIGRIPSSSLSSKWESGTPDETGDGNVRDEEDQCAPSQSGHEKSHMQLLNELVKLSYPLILCKVFQNLFFVGEWQTAVVYCMLTLFFDYSTHHPSHSHPNFAVNIAFLGKLSTNDLAAAALASSWFNIECCYCRSFDSNRCLPYAKS